jgi:hypothetical protein
MTPVVVEADSVRDAKSLVPFEMTTLLIDA